MVCYVWLILSIILTFYKPNINFTWFYLMTLTKLNPKHCEGADAANFTNMTINLKHWQVNSLFTHLIFKLQTQLMMKSADSSFFLILKTAARILTSKPVKIRTTFLYSPTKTRKKLAISPKSTKYSLKPSKSLTA